MSSHNYNQLLKFLYFEGYADSYEEAEYILEEMTDEEFEKLIEAKDISQEVALKLADMLKGAPKFSRRGQTAQSLRQYAVARNKKRLAKIQQNESVFEANEKMKGKDPCWKGYEMVGTKKKGNKEVPNCVPKEEFDAIVEYLFVEGYANTIESAELMAESISEEWANEILESRDIESPKERLKTDRHMFSIPTDEREAARERTLKKAAEIRKKQGK